VTHGFHMPRARKVFEEVAAGAVTIVPAPMGLAERLQTPVLEWLPSTEGFQDTRRVLRELLGALVGA
jgi:uncharacterized SAM-binding protein YcdF (DUF218 family)